MVKIATAIPSMPVTLEPMAVTGCAAVQAIATKLVRHQAGSDLLVGRVAIEPVHPVATVAPAKEELLLQQTGPPGVTGIAP